MPTENNQAAPAHNHSDFQSTFNADTQAILGALRERGHASNLELHLALADVHPDLSLESIDAVTKELLEAGTIGRVRTGADQAILDTRSEIHDHFVCTRCAGVVDLTLAPETTESIQEQLGTHTLDSGLVVNGICGQCHWEIARDAEAAAKAHHDAEEASRILGL